MKPWKSTASMGHGDAVTMRSIELQWGHDDDAVEELTLIVADRRARSTLQWGHGDDAVEDGMRSATHARSPAASMGPRR